MAELAFWIAVVFMVGCNFYFGPRIKADRIAMQWGFNGRPTWYAPKAVGLWGLIVFALTIRLVIWAASTYAPEKVHDADLGLLIFSIVVATAHMPTLTMAARAR